MCLDIKYNYTSTTELAESASTGCKTDDDCHAGGDMGGYCKANGDCHCSQPFFSTNGKTCELSCCPKPDGKSCTVACCRDDDDCKAGGDKGAYCKSPKSTLHTTPGNGMCRCGTGFAGTTSCEKAVMPAWDVQGVAHCTKDSDCPSSYCQNGACHACGDACCLTDKDCPGSYCANDPTKFPPYTCHDSKSAVAEVAPLTDAGFTWDSCGTKLDRLKTAKVSVTGSLTAGSKVTVTASGTTDLHVPLDSGAWQVRIYETGVAKETHTEFGDLMQALKFDDDKNTTFTVTTSFTLPKKQASGEFDANLVAVDQAKADYMCLDIKYKYAAQQPDLLAMVKNLLDTSVYCMNDPSKHAPFYCHVPPLPVNCKTDKDCSNPWMKSYCMNDASKKAPYVCKDVMPPTCASDADCKR